ncbi:hypothetical protein B0H11DRAFT_2359693 [Mycena galericulata]|nr:hypothetical protein B0H11DRAFT_2359693 [Mycena galericulata]
MESKLKSLKVADLRDILAKAHQPPPQKATKPDLIARILASKEATAAYNAKYAPKDDLLAPPEDLDWDVDNVNAPETPVEQPKPTTPAKPEPAAAADPAPPKPAEAVVSTPEQPATVDPEREKLKKRAERFGIPFVETPPSITKKAAPAATPKLSDAPEKLNARAARFGTKRAAPAEEVDAEEQERRRKRAERFGTGPGKA